MSWWKTRGSAEPDQEDDVEMPPAAALPAAVYAREGGTPFQDAAATARITHTDALLLEAVRAAGLTTPELFAARITEHAALFSAETTRRECAREAQVRSLADAKHDAGAAAVIAFGQNSPLLTAAQETIAAQESVSALSAMTAAYQAVRPSPLKPGLPRQTVGSAPTLTEDAAPKEDAVAKGLDPNTVYNNRRPKSTRR